MEKIKEQNNLYEQFLKYSYKYLEESFKKAKTKEEQERVIGKN